MPLTVNTDDLGRVIVDFGNKVTGMDSRASLIVRKAAFDVERFAKTNAPVDTGFLRNSIVTETVFNNWRLYAAEVRAEAEYAPFVEWGTSRMAPQPYMAPALERVEPGFLAALEAIADPLDGR